ncbi:MAG TPA: HEAT repeat domain-containing protein [Rhodocyclaceae bacterium]|nr:HEAT repeat domain-containing protein [Rhodocyclaceae bacterium]
MAFVKKKTSEAVNEDERKRGRDCESLLAELESPRAIERRWAARDLTDFPQATAALVARLRREDDASVREIIFSTLTVLGDDIAVAGLVDCLKSEDASLRNEAIEAMKQLPDEVAPIMHGLLADTNPDVRIFAVNILESLRHPHVEAWLLEVIEHDTHVNVCATAVDLLVEVGSGAAQQPLLELKQRFPAEPYIQFAVDLALKRIAAG